MGTTNQPTTNMATSVVSSNFDDSMMSNKSDGTSSTHPYDHDDSGHNNNNHHNNNNSNRKHRHHSHQERHGSKNDPTNPASSSSEEDSDDNSDDHNNGTSTTDFHRLSIPSFLTQHGQNLAQLDQTMLAQCLQPVMRSLKHLDAESLLNLERVENGARLCDGYVEVVLCCFACAGTRSRSAPEKASAL